jgi:hypothetical protein
MLAPNNLEFFYEEKETSPRVFKYHRRLNLMWHAATIGLFALCVFAFFRARD